MLDDRWLIPQLSRVEQYSNGLEKNIHQIGATLTPVAASWYARLLVSHSCDENALTVWLAACIEWYSLVLSLLCIGPCCLFVFMCINWKLISILKENDKKKNQFDRSFDRHFVIAPTAISDKNLHSTRDEVATGGQEKNDWKSDTQHLNTFESIW